MTSPSVGRIERVPLREVWAHEALNFTVWLETNIDLLNEYLAVPIEHDTVSREAAAGAFAVDLVAEDANGDIVIIENQLERSNHDHLGKLITYAAMRSAKTAVWIVADPRDEHVRAISWLNDAGLAAFWLFKIEAIRIGESLPAPLLTKIVGPSEDVPQRPDLSPQGERRERGRLAFSQQLLEHAATLTNLHAGLGPGTRAWFGTRIAAGMNLVYGVRQSGTRVMLFIDRGVGRIEENDAIYQALLGHRDQIERDFGDPLTWEAKENNRSRQVSLDLSLGGWAQPETWPTAIKATVDAMIRFDSALRPHVPEALTAADTLASVSPPGEDDTVLDETLDMEDEESLA